MKVYFFYYSRCKIVDDISKEGTKVSSKHHEDIIKIRKQYLELYSSGDVKHITEIFSETI